ncbi:MAG: cytochrome c oxidase subunit [Acidimicrobiaceae bacterium]|jgi:cytochrome c oxidase subunit 3
MAAVTGANDVRRRPSPLAIGVIVWLSSELMFFSGLFAAWFTLRASTSPWPPVGVELATGRTALATGVLIASSLTMHGAVRAGEREDRAKAIRWLALTALLGLVFLGNQALEYRQAPFSISSHAYGSIFYLMTGFHGLHVLGGLLFMGAVAATIGGRTSKAPAGPTVEVCAFYWHFVDVVWVAMFSTIYLLS